MIEAFVPGGEQRHGDALDHRFPEREGHDCPEHVAYELRRLTARKRLEAQEPPEADVGMVVREIRREPAGKSLPEIRRLMSRELLHRQTTAIERSDQGRSAWKVVVGECR